MKMKNKLNMGCFDNVMEGYVNLDKEKFFEGIDVVHNLEEFPYPFKDDTFDEINADSVLEHLDVDRIKFYEELHRICQNGAIIKTRVPYKDKIWKHPDHKGGGFTFNYFKKLCNAREYITKKKFELVLLTHSPTRIARLIPSRLRILLSHFINEVIEDVIVEMKVVK